MVFSQSCSYSRETKRDQPNTFTFCNFFNTKGSQNENVQNGVKCSFLFVVFHAYTERESFEDISPFYYHFMMKEKKKSLDYLLLHTELQEKSSLGTVFTSQQPQISNFKQLYMSGFPLKGNERRCGEWQESNLELR
jgi:diaminopimelate epimerase